MSRLNTAKAIAAGVVIGLAACAVMTAAVVGLAFLATFLPPSTLIFASTAAIALYAAYAQHDARKAARRASDAARVAEDAATTARAVANREAFDRLGVTR